MFVHWLSIVHIAASAIAFTPSDDASLTAVLPHDWLSSVFSTGPPTPVPPGAVPSLDPSEGPDPALPPEGSVLPANGFAVPGEIVIKGTPGSGAYGTTCTGGPPLSVDGVCATPAVVATRVGPANPRNRIRKRMKPPLPRGFSFRFLRANGSDHNEQSPSSYSRLCGVCRHMVLSHTSRNRDVVPNPSDWHITLFWLR
jgi:hypothetical protein